jgi:hypothetical protein
MDGGKWINNTKGKKTSGKKKGVSFNVLKADWGNI